MRDDFPCPVCSGKSWKMVQTFRLASEDTPRKNRWSDGMLRRIRKFKRLAIAFLLARPFPRTLRTRQLLAFEKFRRRVLFEIWRPGAEHVELSTQYCSDCGMMVFTPRPDDDDMRRKYQFLNESEEHKSKRRKQLDTKDYLNNIKVKTVHRLLDPMIPDQGSLLDVGGAEGRYLTPFLAQGRTGDLVDFYDEQLPEVRKVGDELADLPEGAAYDALLCIATLEHVTDPRGMVQAMWERLRPGGVLYAEVPNEVFGNLTRNIAGDPTTHVNFFTPASFQSLFLQCGFSIVDSNPNPYGPIWLIGRRDGVDPAPASLAPLDIARHLNPPRAAVFQRVRRRIKEGKVTY